MLGLAHGQPDGRAKRSLAVAAGITTDPQRPFTWSSQFILLLAAGRSAAVSDKSNDGKTSLGGSHVVEVPIVNPMCCVRGSRVMRGMLFRAEGPLQRLGSPGAFR